MSQNVLGQLRNLVERVAALVHAGQPADEYNYATIDLALTLVPSKGSLIFSAGSLS